MVMRHGSPKAYSYQRWKLIGPRHFVLSVEGAPGTRKRRRDGGGAELGWTLRGGPHLSAACRLQPAGC